MENTLLAEIAMTLLFIAVRARAWKASKELELNGLLGYFISLSIYFIVPFMASSFVRFVLDLPFSIYSIVLFIKICCLFILCLAH